MSVKVFAKRVEWRALDSHVIAVAVEGSIGDWSAYIGAVPGLRHEEEWPVVRAEGNKLPREVAEVLFPSFCDLHWRP